MPTPLHVLHDRRASAPRRGAALSLISSMGVGSDTAPVATTTLAAVRDHDAVPVLPAAAVTRLVDPSGRVKFAGTWSLRDLLGFEPGTLRVVTHRHWLVLTQPDAYRSAERVRFADTAGFSAGKNGERITLSEAHLRRCRLGADRHLLLTPLPDRQALVVVNPAVCFLAAPDPVAEAVRDAAASN